MPEIERVLHSGGTAPPEFTLHDEEHAFRVAERMVDVIPRDVLSALSEFELALLLLSAYLHDIGMTPERAKVKQILRYLETGDEPSLTLPEKQDIQEWLDNASAGVPGEIPRSTNAKSSEDPLELVVAHYCRHKHNDWSESWIRENLSDLKWQRYVGWLDDLVQLCRSHHDGYAELKREEFDPKPAGGASSPVVVHRRYLACVLRISDVLEFDPERTPDIVFTHRSIAKSSEIFWHKDHYVQLVIGGEQRRVFISAEPPDAKVHRAITEMIDQIDAELMLCQRLGNDAPFEKFGPMPDLRHRWDLPPVVDRKVEPKANTYVYIDGAFRPNTQKILELLSGTELYGSNLAAVRELLQNAFDATRELVAREMLFSNASPQSRSVSSDRYAVELRLERQGGRLFLICRDQGVGMTKHIIENYFLVSGSSKRHDILDLERRCEKRGLRLGRSGQFGIGVLSYFMIADQVTILTRRNSACGDAELSGWAFETEGVGSFGELRKNPSGAQGTEVRLRLRDEIASDGPDVFFGAVRDYVRRTVVRAPCRLRLRADFIGVDESYESGWLLDRQLLTEIALGGLGEGMSRGDGPPLGALSSAKRKEIEERSAHRKRIRQEAAAALRWHTFDGDLPSNAGSYRVNVPFFELAGGTAFAFLRAKGSGQDMLLDKISSGVVHTPRGHEISAWRGMRVDARSYHGRNWLHFDNLGIREIDWEASETGSISINRNEITFSGEAGPVRTWLKDRMAEEYRQLAAASKQGAYATLNYRLLREPPPDGTQQRWRSRWRTRQDEPITWESVTFPATTSHAFIYTEIPEGLNCLGRSIGVIPSLAGPGDDHHYDGISWNTAMMQPDRMLVYESFKTRLVPVWDQPPSQRSFTAGPFLLARFPDEWNELSGAVIEKYSDMGDVRVWNTNNPLTSLFAEDDWKWAIGMVKPGTDPLAIGDRILASKGRTAAWLGLTVGSANQDLWRGIAERDPAFLGAVWDRAFGGSMKDFQIKLWVEGSSGLRVVSATAWDFLKEVPRWKERDNTSRLNGGLLPVAGAIWTLTSKEGQELARFSGSAARAKHRPRA